VALASGEAGQSVDAEEPVSELSRDLRSPTRRRPADQARGPAVAKWPAQAAMRRPEPPARNVRGRPVPRCRP